MNVNIAIVEDRALAHKKARLAIRDKRSRGYPDLHIIESLSNRIISEENFNSLILAIGDFSDDLVLILDMSLDLPFEVREMLRTEYEIPKSIPDDKVDGIVVAIEVIRSKSIKRALILISTSFGYQDSIEQYLEKNSRCYKRENAIKILSSPGGHSLSSSRESASKEIIDYATSSFLKFFGDSFESFFLMIKEIEHDQCRGEKADELLCELLCFKAEQFSQIFHRKRKVLHDVLKYTGSACSYPLSPTAAWLLALAAYKHQQPDKDWESVFSVNDLKDDLREFKLIPPQETESLRTSIRAFYTMCFHLFESSWDVQRDRGTLECVTLSREKGLRFLLNFSSVGKPGSLYERIRTCAKASFQEQALPQHQTSRAIWSFWLASSVADREPLDEEGIFSPIWRMNIVPAGERNTEVIFHA